MPPKQVGLFLLRLGLKPSARSEGQRSSETLGLIEIQGCLLAQTEQEMDGYCLRFSNRSMYLGCFAIEEDAARAYDKSCPRTSWPNSPMLNFPATKRKVVEITAETVEEVINQWTVHETFLPILSATHQ